MQFFYKPFLKAVQIHKLKQRKDKGGKERKGKRKFEGFPRFSTRTQGNLVNLS